jgi:hypothetical protein
MALTKTVETQFGITVSNSYIRVEYPALTKDTLSFHVRMYASVSKPFFDEKVFSCDYDILGENPFKQAYKYIKSLSEFSDATDA